MFIQGIFTEGEDSVRLTSLYTKLRPAAINTKKIFSPFYNTSYLNNEDNRTEPLPSIGFTWFVKETKLKNAWSRLKRN